MVMHPCMPLPASGFIFSGFCFFWYFALVLYESRFFFKGLRVGDPFGKKFSDTVFVDTYSGEIYRQLLYVDRFGRLPLYDRQCSIA